MLCVEIPAYHWRNNVLHGTVDNGISTQFPQATGLAASWNASLLRTVGRICGREQRAKHNIAVDYDGVHNPSTMNYGLDLWGPSEWGHSEHSCPDR